MGQYHAPVCADRREYVYAGALGCGLKQYEITHSSASVMDAVAIMLADPGMPRDRRQADLHVPGRTGRWAGHAIFYIGDYGEDGDAPEGKWTWDIPEGEMWSTARDEFREVGRPLARHIARAHDLVATETKTILRHQDGTRDVLRRTEMVGVDVVDGKLKTIPWGTDNPHWVKMAEDAQKVADGIDPATYGIDSRDGQRRLIVNLDRREYIDPRPLGEDPTMVGILRANMKNHVEGVAWSHDDPEAPSALGAFNEMLFHSGSRGGGDEETAITGRWRCDRVILTAERSKRFPTTTGVERDPSFRDITPIVLKLEPRIDWPAIHKRLASKAGRP